jgi:type VI secretion system ImpM family protein
MNGSDPSTQVRARDPVPEPDLAGWFGKIPALGDFVTRRLPPTFVDPWDEWLSAELVAAQSELADAWLSTYREAPLWRFALMAGAIDRGRWYGIWLPSFDRVGRQFPLTIAVSSPSSADAVRRWWAAFVATAQRAAEPSCDADCVDAALRAFLGDQATVEDWAEPFERRIAPTLASIGEGSSLWWPWFADDPAGATPRTFDGLPRGEDFLELLCAR